MSDFLACDMLGNKCSDRSVVSVSCKCCPFREIMTDRPSDRPTIHMDMWLHTEVTPPIMIVMLK